MSHAYWKRFFMIGLVVTATLFGTGCTPTGDALENESTSTDAEDLENNDDEKKADERVPVETAVLGEGAIESVLRFSTNLEAERAVGVFAEASRQVLALNVEEGDYVKKGQVVVRLKDDEQQSALTKAKSQLEKAKREFDRQQRLFKAELIPEQAFNDATYELDQAQIAIDDAERELSYTQVRAPISGTITERMVNLGATVTMNQKLFEMVDFDSIVARVFVPEKDMADVRVGLSARITAEPLGDARWNGRVDRIAPVVDAQSGTIKTTVSIPRNRALRPGTFVEVELVTAVHEDALLVPKRAIVFDNDQAFVFRITDGEDKDGNPAKVAQRLMIDTLLEDRAFVEPKLDTVLGFGDRIVVAGQAGLKDGATVRLLDLATGDAQQDDDADEDASAAEAREAA